MNDIVIPNHIQIEIVTGYCTAKCTFCTIDSWTRPNNIMSTDFFKKVLGRFDRIKSEIEFVSLLGCGETLLDKEIDLKIRYAKDQGYRGVGFATNATELDEDCSRRLIAAGLDTLIISIDGIDKETHEGIRIGTDFDVVCENTKRFINIRNEIKGSTRVLVRFVRTEENYDQWPAFREYWLKYVDKGMKDDVIMHDVHNWGKGESKEERVYPENVTCPDLFSKITIYSDGHMALCCADDNGMFNLGSVLEKDPLDIYNGELFSKYRKYMSTGRVGELVPCNKCTVIDSRLNKVKPEHIRVSEDKE